MTFPASNFNPVINTAVCSAALLVGSLFSGCAYSDRWLTSSSIREAEVSLRSRGYTPSPVNPSEYTRPETLPALQTVTNGNKITIYTSEAGSPADTKEVAEVARERGGFWGYTLPRVTEGAVQYVILPCAAGWAGYKGVQTINSGSGSQTINNYYNAPVNNGGDGNVVGSPTTVSINQTTSCGSAAK